MDKKIDNEFRAIFKLHIFMKRNKIPLVGIYFPIQALNFLVFTLQFQFSPCLWKKIWKISKCFEKQLTTKYYKLSKSGEARKYFFNTRKYLFKFSITRVNLFDDPGAMRVTFFCFPSYSFAVQRVYRHENKINFEKVAKRCKNKNSLIGVLF